MDLTQELHEMRRQNSIVLYGLAEDDLDDRTHDRELEAITRTAAHTLKVPYAGVNILDHAEQVTLASSDARERHSVPRAESVCSIVLAQTDSAVVIEIPDASVEDRLRSLPCVDGQRDSIRFYAAAPLVGVSGVAIGTLCVVDHHPRSLDDDERRLLLHLGYAVVHVLDRRRSRTAVMSAELPARPVATAHSSP